LRLTRYSKSIMQRNTSNITHQDALETNDGCLNSCLVISLVKSS
jgi:ribosomal protein S3AE